ncbi:MAG: hypothetical protein B0W54_09385 [Cellvibrio sp. 79]|nr:MAG: hypothetical protein B0W54_09385 [Cellvibrio sp. 79]
MVVLDAHAFMAAVSIGAVFACLRKKSLTKQIPTGADSHQAQHGTITISHFSPIDVSLNHSRFPSSNCYPNPHLKLIGSQLL